MPRPVHFEIHAADPARAKAFYEKVFGWSFHKWEGAALEYWLAAALAAGASIALPKAPIPGVGWLAYVHDTEGNVLGMTQPDPSAK